MNDRGPSTLQPRQTYWLLLIATLAVATIGCSKDAPADLTCHTTCASCGPNEVCAGAGTYTSAACLRPCASGSDCPAGQRCVMVDETGSWWTYPINTAVCVGDDLPPHCGGAPTAGACTDFLAHCLDASHLAVPWFGQQNRICGFEVTTCAGGCEVTGTSQFPCPCGRCK